MPAGHVFESSKQQQWVFDRRWLLHEAQHQHIQQGFTWRETWAAVGDSEVCESHLLLQGHNFFFKVPHSDSDNQDLSKLSFDASSDSTSAGLLTMETDCSRTPAEVRCNKSKITPRVVDLRRNRYLWSIPSFPVVSEYLWRAVGHHFFLWAAAGRLSKTNCMKLDCILVTWLRILAFRSLNSSLIVTTTKLSLETKLCDVNTTLTPLKVYWALAVCFINADKSRAARAVINSGNNLINNSPLWICNITWGWKLVWQ